MLQQNEVTDYDDICFASQEFVLESKTTVRPD